MLRTKHLGSSLFGNIHAGDKRVQVPAFKFLLCEPNSIAARFRSPDPGIGIAHDITLTLPNLSSDLLQCHRAYNPKIQTPLSPTQPTRQPQTEESQPCSKGSWPKANRRGQKRDETTAQRTNEKRAQVACNQPFLDS